MKSCSSKKQNIVIGLTSSSGNERFNLYYKGGISVNWGDGTKDYLYSTSDAAVRVFSHTYSTPYTGNITINGSINLIKRISTIVSNSVNMTFTQSQMQKMSNITNITQDSSNTRYKFNLDVSKIPSKIETFYIAGANQCYGTVSNLPVNLTDFVVGGQNTISGDISTFFGTWSHPESTYPIFPNLNRINITGNNTITGNLSSLARGVTTSYSLITTFYLGGNNTVTGDISYLTYLPNLQSCNIDCNNIISGDIASLSAPLNNLVLSGSSCSVTGDISNLPSTLEQFNLYGVNTTYGDIANLKPGLRIYNNRGYNTTTGDIANLPSSLTYYYNAGSNTVTGDIANLKTSLTSFYSVAGFVYGDLSNLNTSSLDAFYTGSSCYITGDIKYIPASCNYFATYNCAVTGTVSNLLSTSFTTFYVSGTPSIGGDLINFPSTIGTLYIYNNDKKLNYTAGKTWSSTMFRVVIRPTVGNGFTSTETDNLLIDLYNTGATWPAGSGSAYRYVSIARTSRTSASDAAVFGLTSSGITVIITA